MKYFFVLVLLIYSTGYTQVPRIDEPDIILPLLVEFKNEARKRSLFIDGMLAKHLGAVRKVSPEQMKRLYKPREGYSEEDTPLGILGTEVVVGLYNYSFIHPVIYLREDVYLYPDGLRHALFHELGHFLGLDHSYGIMLKVMSINTSYTEEEWEYLLDDFYAKVRDLPRESYRTRHDNTYY